MAEPGVLELPDGRSPASRIRRISPRRRPSSPGVRMWTFRCGPLSSAPAQVGAQQRLPGEDHHGPQRVVTLQRDVRGERRLEGVQGPVTRRGEGISAGAPPRRAPGACDAHRAMMRSCGPSAQPLTRWEMVSHRLPGSRGGPPI